MSYTRGPGIAHWHSIDTINSGLLPPQTTLSSLSNFPTADTSVYVPVIVRNVVMVRKLFFAEGTIGSANYDLGLYDSAGVALLRKGSTAMTGSASDVIWDCTDTYLPRGLYYIGLACSNTREFIGSTSPAAPFLASIGLFTEATFPLPATATFAVPQTLAFYPVCGMLLNTVAS